MPEHVIVIGSGVTGVEFVHMFESMGAQVTLVVSRPWCSPKRPRGCCALEEDFLRREVKLFKGARAESIVRGQRVIVSCDDGRIARGSHALLAIGSVPNSDGLCLDDVGVQTDHGYVPVNNHMQSNIPHIYAAGDLSRTPSALVGRHDAGTQDRRTCHGARRG